MEDNAAWALEERFWLEGSTVYDALLDPECLMVFPAMGVMRAADVLESLKSAPRWTSVTMEDRTVGRPHGDLLLLGYKAIGRRDKSQIYSVFCTSTYRRDLGTWKLVQHQQTLAG